MAQEIEIKLRLQDARKLRLALKKMRARLVFGGSGRVHERNVVFDTPDGKLKKRGELLRIRTETPADGGRNKAATTAGRVILTLKRPSKRGSPGVKSGLRAPRHKVREELELQVADGEALAAIFEGLGMRPWFRYEKIRTTYRLPESQRWAKGLLIELDETPIGTFVELEGPAKAIDRAAKALGFSKSDYLVTNYFVLYRDECKRRGEKVGDMMFPMFQKRKKG